METRAKLLARTEPSYFWMGPLFVMGILDDFGTIGRHPGVGLAMGWGTIVAAPCTIAAMAAIFFHLVRAFYRSLIRR